MSLIDKILLDKLKQLGLKEGTGDFKDYEKAKTLVKTLASNPADYEKITRKLTEYLRCQL